MAALTREDWIGKPCVIIAPGPSLTQQDCDKLLFVPDVKSIVVNDAYLVAPWADILYAGDAIYWKAKRPKFNGEKVLPYGEPQSSRGKVAEKIGATMVPVKWGKGLALDGDYIHAGHCSGFQALNLALNFGSNPIYLLGFDCKPGPGGRLHFNGNHKPPLRNGLPFKKMISEFERAADQLRVNKTVFNLTRSTALSCFPRVNVEEVRVNVEEVA